MRISLVELSILAHLCSGTYFKKQLSRRNEVDKELRKLHDLMQDISVLKEFQNPNAELTSPIGTPALVVEPRTLF